MAEPDPLTKDLARRALWLRSAVDHHAREVLPLRKKLADMEPDVKAFMGLDENAKTLPANFETRLTEKFNEVRAKNQDTLQRLQQQAAQTTDPQARAKLQTGIVAAQNFLTSVERLVTNWRDTKAQIETQDKILNIVSTSFEQVRQEVRKTINSPAARQFQEIMNGVDLRGMDGVYERNPAQTSGDAPDYVARFQAKFKIEDFTPPR